MKLQLKERLMNDYLNRNNDRKKPDTEFRDFCRLLKALISDKDIKDKQTMQIAIQLIEKGPNTLSENQWDHFYDNGIGKSFYVEGKCMSCEMDISWHDMLAAFLNDDNLCSACRLDYEDGEMHERA